MANEKAPGYGYNGEGYRYNDDRVKKSRELFDEADIPPGIASDIKESIELALASSLLVFREIDKLRFPDGQKNILFAAAQRAMDGTVKAAGAIYIEAGSGTEGDKETDKKGLRNIPHYFR